MRSVASKLMWVRRADKALVFALATMVGLATGLLALVLATVPAEADFPGPNGKIVFSSNRAAPDGSTDYEIYRMNADGRGLTQLTNNTANDREPTTSSDGSRIAFSLAGKIWLMNANGSGQAPLTSDQNSNGSDPTFSPDGSKVAFANNFNDIVVMNADGSGVPIKVTGGPVLDSDPAWSPDGSKIAYPSQSDSSNGTNIFVKNADGSGTPTNLTPDLSVGDEYAPAWSPDGSKIAFHYEASSDGDLFVMDSDGTGLTELFGLTSIGSDTGFQAEPDFSPDGSKIAFRRGDDVLMGNADGSGTPLSVASGRATESEPDWGPLNFDLSLVQSDSPDPVKVNNNLTYTLEVTNEGFDAAPNVVLTDRLPTGVAFVSASTHCTHSAGKVTCNLGSGPSNSPTFPAGATVTKTITVKPTAQDTITNTASVESSDPEITYTANNTDRERTDVTLNRAPVANEDSYVTREDTPLTVAAPGVLSDDTDADGDPLTVASVPETTGAGTLTHNANGSFTYTPSNNSNGADAFTYKATDGTAQSNAATVTIVVRAVNDAPDAVNDSAQTEKDTALDVNVLANDRDPERDEISVTGLSDPAHGTATLNADGTVRYAPDPAYTGSDPFTYDVSDGNGGTDTATLTVTVSDTAAPSVEAWAPKGTKVLPTAKPTVTFSEAMDEASVEASDANGMPTTVFLKKGSVQVAARVALDGTGEKATLTPTRALKRGATYSVAVTSAATDAAGNALDQDPGLPGDQGHSWSFKVRR